MHGEWDTLAAMPPRGCNLLICKVCVWCGFLWTTYPHCAESVRNYRLSSSCSSCLGVWRRRRTRNSKKFQKTRTWKFNDKWRLQWYVLCGTRTLQTVMVASKSIFNSSWTKDNLVVADLFKANNTCFIISESTKSVACVSLCVNCSCASKNCFVKRYDLFSLVFSSWTRCGMPIIVVFIMWYHSFCKKASTSEKHIQIIVVWNGICEEVGYPSGLASE